MFASHYVIQRKPLQAGFRNAILKVGNGAITRRRFHENRSNVGASPAPVVRKSRFVDMDSSSSDSESNQGSESSAKSKSDGGSDSTSVLSESTEAHRMEIFDEYF